VGSGCIDPHILGIGSIGGEWSASRPGLFTAGENPRYPLDRRLDGPQNRSGLSALDQPQCRLLKALSTEEDTSKSLKSLVTFWPLRRRLGVTKHSPIIRETDSADASLMPVSIFWSFLPLCAFRNVGTRDVWPLGKRSHRYKIPVIGTTVSPPGVIGSQKDLVFIL
jgi:hypothetical protein